MAGPLLDPTLVGAIKVAGLARLLSRVNFGGGSFGGLLAGNWRQPVLAMVDAHRHGIVDPIMLAARHTHT